MTDKIDKQRQDQILIQEIKARLPELKKLLGKVSSEWGYEDSIYRFYHHSFKVFRIQESTLEMVEKFKEIKAAVVAKLPPENPPPESASQLTKELWDYRINLNSQFLNLMKRGTGLHFRFEHNEEWDKHTAPMVEAFFHARFMLEMLVKYGTQLDDAVQLLPSGWAAALYLFNMR